MGTVGYLLDTHTFLWAVRKAQELSDSVRKVIENESLAIFVSSISAYEIANKYRIGKLPGYEYLIENYFEVLDGLGASELPVNTHHTHFAGKFEWNHRDPFDRILAAQAFSEKLTLMTNDPEFQSLPWITILW